MTHKQQNKNTFKKTEYFIAKSYNEDYIQHFGRIFITFSEAKNRNKFFAAYNTWRTRCLIINVFHITIFQATPRAIRNNALKNKLNVFTHSLTHAMTHSLTHIDTYIPTHTHWHIHTQKTRTY